MGILNVARSTVLRCSLKSVNLQIGCGQFWAHEAVEHRKIVGANARGAGLIRQGWASTVR